MQIYNPETAVCFLKQFKELLLGYILSYTQAKAVNTLNHCLCANLKVCRDLSI